MKNVKGEAQQGEGEAQRSRKRGSKKGKAKLKEAEKEAKHRHPPSQKPPTPKPKAAKAQGEAEGREKQQKPPFWAVFRPAQAVTAWPDRNVSAWNLIKSHIAAYIIVTVLSTFIVMGAAGAVTQFVIRKNKEKK